LTQSILPTATASMSRTVLRRDIDLPGHRVALGADPELHWVTAGIHVVRTR
jgi:hypothetical protein